ncbi:hypothetical protein M5689_004479 [Euphorbia peplus]|nr:hypothetical protein M5689_004479 [Euphorbia peplus]
MKISDHEKDKNVKEDKILSVWDLGSPLYDSYELVTLSHIIDRHLMIFPFYTGRSRSSLVSKNVCLPQEAVSSTGSSRRRRCSTMIAMVEFVMTRLKIIRRNRSNVKKEYQVWEGNNEL